MIIIKSQGRLGNQLFQYAFARNINEKLYNGKEEIKLNYSKSKYANHNILGDDDNGFKLHKLGVTNLKLNIFQLLLFYTYLVLRYLFKINLNKKITKIFSSFGIYILQNDTNEIIEFKKSKMKNKVVFGYFASEKYFEESKDIIKNEFSVTKNLKGTNKKVLETIKLSNSIAIMIRRGDYVNNEYFYVCNEQYYYDAIEQAKKDIKNPLFVVFSDDIEWVKNNMDLPKNTIYENQSNDVLTTLYLMINCKHYIISNSTFHWWAQYLSNNDVNKKVYAPSKWNNCDTAKTIYQKNWTIIKIKKNK